MTTKIRFTKTSVQALQPGEKQVRVWDTSLRGFGVLVSPGGAKSYFLQRKLHGRSLRISIGRADDLSADQARRKAEEYVAQIAQGIDPIAEAKAAQARALTLADAFDMYVDAPKKKGGGRGGQKSPQTIRDIRKAERRFSDWLALPVTEITGDMVRKRHAELAKTSPAQANLACRYLRAAFGHIMVDTDDDPVIARNPVDRLNRASAWAEVKPRKRHLPNDRIVDWIAAVQEQLAGLRHDNEIRDALMFMLLTGCRLAEALGNEKDAFQPLTWRDVDLDTGTITFRHTKNRQEHVLPVGRRLHALLKDRRRVSGLAVFSDKADRVPSDLRAAYRRIEGVTGLWVTAHDLRRSFASTANRIGLPGYTVKRLMNHISGGDVTEGYITVGLDDMRRAMQRIEDHMLTPAPTENVVSIAEIAKGNSSGVAR
ncbi:integrase arm-type DNA-binding domain-containing protein [Rhodobacterales bacterium HKCCE3408]|nr:integrase arm-type DNA-binding domain-containing protein [Rhodobacterales bacterium HKCCE3408]